MNVDEYLRHCFACGASALAIPFVTFIVGIFFGGFFVWVGITGKVVADALDESSGES